MAGLRVVSDPHESEPVDWETRLWTVLDDPALIHPHFQPIVDIARGQITGYEMLARFRLPGGDRPADWFDAAVRHGLVERLDAALLASSLGALGKLPQNTFLTVNVTPAGAGSPLVREVLGGAGSLAPLVVELTEQTESDDPYGLVDFAAFVRKRGAMMAVDDVGTGYSSLQRVMALRPEFVKIDRSFVTSMHTDEAKVAAVEMMGGLADRIDAWVIAEGVEHLAELDRLEMLGVPLAQGYLLAHPEPELRERLEGPVVTRVRRVLDSPRDEIADIADAIEPERDPVSADRALSRFAADVALDYLPVLDEFERPKLLIRRPRAGETPRFQVSPMSVHPGADIARVARRAMARGGADRFAPIFCCGAEGRYIGLVRIERIIDALTADAYLPTLTAP